MNLTIYHNPSCSKSRKTLEIIESKGLSPKIIEYLKEPPDGETVLRIARLLGTPVADMLRTGEEAYESLVSEADPSNDAELAAALERFPRALQRPIVVDENHDRAVIGRPPENVLRLLGD